MTSNQQPPYPGFQPYVQPQPYVPQQGAPYPQQAQGVPYPQQPQGSPYPQHPPPAYPQQPAGFPQQPAGFPQQPPAYHQDPQNMNFVNAPYVAGVQVSPQQFPQVPQDDISEEGKGLTGTWTGFSDRAIRQAFVRKVYAILMVQLTFSLGVIAVFVFVDKVKRFVRANMYIYTISYVTFSAVYIALVCCGNLRRKWPTNIIMLSVFTITMSYMLGTISSFHDTKIVMMAVGICAACCLAVSVFSFYTKFDFTTCGGVLCILVWVLFIFGIVAVATFRFFPILNTIYAACGALLFIMAHSQVLARKEELKMEIAEFLAYDTQQMMGGKKHELSAEEHIFAAISLYIDVVYIFLFILMFAGSKK